MEQNALDKELRGDRQGFMKTAQQYSEKFRELLAKLK